MKILIVTPAPRGSRTGNRVTALRWSRLLRQLGHHVAVRHEYRDERGDLLIALHARRSFDAVARFRAAHPERPIVVTLTGTDLYDEIHREPEAYQALDWAARLVVLQPLGVAELPEHLRGKTRVIYQSSSAPRAARSSRNGVFEVCVLGHLRPVKDPFRTALAARLLPESSRVQVLHLGAALTPDMLREARREAAVNRRYRWLGDLPRWRALRILARCRLLVQSSLLEGGPNSISEALAASVPVLSSRIPGASGLLGADYAGYFPAGDAQALAALLNRAESDTGFYQSIQAHCRRLRPLVAPTRERASWRSLLRELVRGNNLLVTSAPKPKLPRARGGKR